MAGSEQYEKGDYPYGYLPFVIPKIRYIKTESDDLILLRKYASN